MSTGFAAIALLAAAAITLTSTASAGPTAKQQVAIKWKEAGGFVLTPVTAGALRGDSGTASFCCWTTRVIRRYGLKTETGDPLMTLSGVRGTLVASNRMEFNDIRGGYALFTGTWKVVRGTGDYAGLSGGGRVAGIVLPNGDAKWQRDGFLGPK